MVMSLPHNIFSSHIFHNLVFLRVVQGHLRAQTTPRTAFRQEGEDDEDIDTHAYVHEWCMGWIRRRSIRFSKSRRKPGANPIGGSYIAHGRYISMLALKP